MASMVSGFQLALFAIFALLAIPFRSYSQPLIIMAAIPFGIVGAVGGHLIMGYDLSILSIFGIVALAGVVVNDSLLLIDRINQNRREGGENLLEALLDAGQRRFRPILLTSLTTFFRPGADDHGAQRSGAVFLSPWPSASVSALCLPPASLCCSSLPSIWRWRISGGCWDCRRAMPIMAALRTRCPAACNNRRNTVKRLTIQAPRRVFCPLSKIDCSAKLKS